ncbi:MAG: hypothetical protein ACI9AR_000090 [Flavobacteriaceae bacterium]|jgi:hypothetical protein
MQTPNNNQQKDVLDELNTIMSEADTSVHKKVVITEELSLASRSKYSLYVGVGVLVLVVIAGIVVYIDSRSSRIDEGIFPAEVQYDILAENKRRSGEVNISEDEQRSMSEASSYSGDVPFSFENLGQRHK